MAEQEEKHQEEVESRKSPSGSVVYSSILSEAREELARPSSALFWSGLAAGLSMGFSVLGVALLRAYLPDAKWERLVSSFGYSLGFLVVILGRQQLFTENTLTPVLVFLRRRNMRTFFEVLRLWVVIFIANMAGALAVSYVLVTHGVLAPEVRESVLKVSAEAFHGSFGNTVFRGVFAGWLLALIVWLLPFAETARIHVIILLTYLVSLGDFPHIIAGAVETFGLAWEGREGWGAVIGGYIVPTFIGNVIGGVTLVAAIGHAQVLSGASGDGPPGSQKAHGEKHPIA